MYIGRLHLVYFTNIRNVTFTKAKLMGFVVFGCTNFFSEWSYFLRNFHTVSRWDFRVKKLDFTKYLSKNVKWATVRFSRKFQPRSTRFFNIGSSMFIIQSTIVIYTFFREWYCNQRGQSLVHRRCTIAVFSVGPIAWKFFNIWPEEQDLRENGYPVVPIE